VIVIIIIIIIIITILKCVVNAKFLTIFFLAAKHWFFSSYTHQCDQLQRIFFLAAKLMKVSQQASCEWHVRERERESERERGCLWAQSLTRPLPEALMDICPMTD